MEHQDLHGLLAAVREGTISVADAEHRLSQATFDDLGYAKPDLDRARRQGVSEVIYGAGKTAAQIAGIVRSLRAGGNNHLLVTRLDASKAQELSELVYVQDFQIHEAQRLARGEASVAEVVVCVEACGGDERV